jgi:hypothetical protein
MTNKNIHVKNVVVKVYVNIINKKVIVLIVLVLKDLKYVNMVKENIYVLIVMVLKYVFIKNIKVVVEYVHLNMNMVNINIYAQSVIVYLYVNIIE